MKNYKSKGDVVTAIAPSGGAAVDVGYIIDGMFLVATGGGVASGQTVVSAGSEFEGMRTGVIELAKTAAQAWTQGAVISWDDTAKEATTSPADMVIGVAAEAAAGADARGTVILNGTSNPTLTAAAGRFVSTEQTGTGAPQNIAHGLGVVPSAVFVSPTDLSPATTGDYTVVEGAHDATDVIVTVTLDKKYKILAFA